MNVDNDMDPDFEEQCNIFRGALKGVSELVSAQTPGIAVPSDHLAELLQALVRMADEVVPQESRTGRPRASND